MEEQRDNRFVLLSFYLRQRDEGGKKRSQQSEVRSLVNEERKVHKRETPTGGVEHSLSC
jgi:uncharacterized protein YdaU (DUF1376 family)